MEASLSELKAALRELNAREHSDELLMKLAESPVRLLHNPGSLIVKADLNIVNGAALMIQWVVLNLTLLDSALKLLLEEMSTAEVADVFCA